MADEPNIAELAVAAWRLERWLDNLVAERKMAAKSSLRAIKKYLDASGIEIIDPLGSKFDPGLAIEVINNEAEEVDESELIIIDTNSPVVKKDGAVIQYGRVVLGTMIKEKKVNNEIKTGDTAKEFTCTVMEQPEFIQTDLQVDNDQCWTRKIDIRKDKPGFIPALRTASNVDTLLFLLDKQQYTDWKHGVQPRNPFSNTVKAGQHYFKFPYRDQWYVYMQPPAGHFCSEFMTDFEFEWAAEDKYAAMPDKTDAEIPAGTEDQSIVERSAETPETPEVPEDVEIHSETQNELGVRQESDREETQISENTAAAAVKKQRIANECPGIRLEEIAFNVKEPAEQHRKTDFGKKKLTKAAPKRHSKKRRAHHKKQQRKKIRAGCGDIDPGSAVKMK